MNRKILITASLILSLSATFVIWRRVKNAELEILKGQDRGKIAVASKTLQPGDPFDRDHVAALSIPRVSIFSRMVKGSEFPLIEGTVSNHTILKGEPITWDDMKEPIELSRFSRIITNGMRALSIPADEHTSFSGMLKPGDHVDIYLTRMKKEGRKETILLLEDRFVAAVGSHYADEESSGEEGGVSSTTLLLSPIQAAVLINAREDSDRTISLVLRNPKEKRRIKVGRSAKGRFRSIEIFNMGTLVRIDKIKVTRGRKGKPGVK